MKNVILVGIILILVFASLPLISAKTQSEKLESVLYQLTQTQNHDEFAKTRGLHLEDGTVRVVIELHNASDTIPDGYGATVETRHENLVQALVPVNSLIELTKEPSINFIRAPLPRQAGEKEEKDTNNSDTGADADKSVPGFTLIMTILGLITVFTLILYKNKIFVYRRERGER